MAQLYSTGPAHVFVAGTGGTVTTHGTPLYLGTAESRPRINIMRHWREAMNDITGQISPMDLMYQGQSGIISVALSRWNEGVYQRIVHRSVNAGANAADILPGVDSETSVGSLMIHEAQLTHLWLTFPKAVLPFYNGGGGLTGNGGPFPLGYHFFATQIADQDEMSPGTDPLVRTLQFKAIRAFDVTTRANFLYDFDVTGLPIVD